MLRGEKVILRARHEADIAILEDGLYTDVTEINRASGRAWWPIRPGSPESKYRLGEHNTDMANFSVLDAASGELAGDCMLWGIDLHNRSAHIGMSLLPSFRRKGLGVDVVRVLCQYAFETLGLHRLQIDTLADNHGMIATAVRAGFQLEGTSREAAWVNGEFADEVIYALLVSQWHAG